MKGRTAAPSGASRPRKPAPVPPPRSLPTASQEDELLSPLLLGAFSRNLPDRQTHCSAKCTTPLTMPRLELVDLRNAAGAPGPTVAQMRNELWLLPMSATHAGFNRSTF